MRRCALHLPLLLFSLLSILARGVTVAGFQICSYNVQKLNAAKAANYRVIHALTRIVSRCDIMLLQEVIDPDGKVIKSLLVSLNRYDEFSYKSVSSTGLGKDLQQYVFIYKKETANVTGQHQYQKYQAFVRNPFSVEFQSKKTAIKSFVLVAFQAEPKKAVQEMDQLYDVFLEVSKKFNNTEVIILGDFHASCAYMTRADKKKIRLFTKTQFSWLIGDKVDTTASDETSCAYDRIVVHGERFLKGITPFSTKVLNVKKEFRLTMSQVLELSDHLPLVMSLKSSALFLQATPLLILLGLSAIVQYFLASL